MRHVSRNHRVALDWLFDRINLDPKIKIKFVDTRNQLVDLLTKGTFTRHEVHHLLCLFNTVNNSMFSCSHFSKEMDESLAMSKRLMQDKQQGEEEEHVIAKIAARATFGRFGPNLSSTATSSTLHSPGNQRASCSTLG